MLLSRVNNIAVYKEKHQVNVLKFLMSRAMRNRALGKMRPAKRIFPYGS